MNLDMGLFWALDDSSLFHADLKMKKFLSQLLLNIFKVLNKKNSCDGKCLRNNI